MVMTLEQIKDKIQSHRSELQQRYQAERIGVFGSHIRGEAREDSDVDVLVEFSDQATLSLFGFIELEHDLENLLGKEVDLVSKPALKPRIGEQILQEVVYI